MPCEVARIAEGAGVKPGVAHNLSDLRRLSPEGRMPTEVVQFAEFVRSKDRPPPFLPSTKCPQVRPLRSFGCVGERPWHHE